jgi:hypothetical protein
VEARAPYVGVFDRYSVGSRRRIDPVSKAKSFLMFTELEPMPLSSKTKRWTVHSKMDTSWLGTVKWYSPWRKYCFFQNDQDCVFDPGCLREIADFMAKETVAHRLGSDYAPRVS